MAGLARAKAQNKRLGRPRVPREIEDRVRKTLAGGTGILSVARQLGVGVSTVQRVRREMGSAS